MITGAIIREQGVTFAVVVVKKYILDSSFESNKTIISFTPLFPGLPIILMAQDHRGIPKYYGQHDITHFLARIPLQSIPWRKYLIN